MRAINQEMQREWEDIRAEFVQKKTKEWSREVDRKFRSILAGTIFKPARVIIGMGVVSLHVRRLESTDEIDLWDICNEVSEADYDQYLEVRRELEDLADEIQGPTCESEPFPMEYNGEYEE